MGFREWRRLSVTRVTTMPTTIAMRQYRSSLTTDTVEGESSIECLMIKFVKVTECRTPMSERSIVFSKVASSKIDAIPKMAIETRRPISVKRKTAAPRHLILIRQVWLLLVYYRIHILVLLLVR